MPWNAVSPDGSKSVKQNTVPMQQNTTYTSDTMNKDHFWNIGVNEDGRHQFVNIQTHTGDPAVAAGMGGVLFLKEVAGGTIEGFYRNAINTYQFIPSFLSGTFTLTSGSGYVNIATIPDGSYGQIYTFKDNPTNGNNMGFGWFKAEGSRVNAYTSVTVFEGAQVNYNIQFANGSDASGLTLKGRNNKGADGAGDYRYRIIYWSL